MYLRGQYQTEIAEHLGVDQATVSRDLAELRKEWLERSINHIDQKKAIELAKLDQLELTYWDAWERSGEPFKSTTEEEGGRYGPKTIEKTEERVGDPRFLDGILRCIERRCAIIGIDAPKRQEHSGLNGGPIETRNHIDLSGLTDEELELLEALQRKLK